MPVSWAQTSSNPSCTAGSAAAGWAAWERWWKKYSPVTHAAGSSLTASQAWVTGASDMSSGASGPPILVGTQPGSTTLESTPGLRRATARASTTSHSLLSATIPQAGAIALQGTDGAAVGRRVLVNGAGGGSGSFAIQLAKRLGAHVTGVDNAGKLDFMRSLGADEVIDYHSEDFTRRHQPYDLILDLVAHRSVFAYRRALARGGRYRCVGGPVPALLRVATIGWLAGRLTHRRMGLLAVKEGPAHFAPLADLCIAGEVSIHVDRTFGLHDVPEALAHVGEGRALGKVVVTMN